MGGFHKPLPLEGNGFGMGLKVVDPPQVVEWKWVLRVHVALHGPIPVSVVKADLLI